MKKLFFTLLVILTVMAITTANAQKVLVTDNAAFTTPTTLLQVHKTASGDMLQLTNGLTGTTPADGFMISQDDPGNVTINNQENASMKFGTNNATHMTIDATGNVTISGNLTYTFQHAVSYYTSLTGYSPNTTPLNTYVEILPGMSSSEADGITFSGDQFTINTPGDYKIDLVIDLSGNDNVDFRVKARKYNGSYTDLPGSTRISTFGSTNYVSLTYFWYVPLVLNDVVSFWIENTTDGTNPKITDMKVYLEKKPQ
jgi:hypothetical protein